MTINKNGFWMENNFSFIRKVQYYETDQMGVVHHSNYIRWFEESRVHMMDVLGYTYQTAEKNGLIIPVIGINCRYKSPARFGDTVKIVPKISLLRAVKMTITYRVYNNMTGDLLAEGESMHCFTDRNFKPVSLKNHAPKLHEIFMKTLSEND